MKSVQKLAWLVLSLVLLGCGSGVTQSPKNLDAPSINSGLQSLQMYLVLTRSKEAMQTAADVQNMWRAVHGELHEFDSIRRRVGWAPRDYQIDVELDFADLPHPSLPSAILNPIIARLPEQTRARIPEAHLAISVRSKVQTLPQGGHVRLVGSAVLFIAEKYDGIIIDLLAQRAWRPAEWRAELSAASLSNRQTKLVVSRLSDDRLRLRSRGNLKFGVPDMELDVSRSKVNEAKRRFSRAQRRIVSGEHVKSAYGVTCAGSGYDGACLKLDSVD